MKFTLSWLLDHLETTASTLEITNALVDLGLEIEGVENPGEKIAAFVVATVETANRHPDADRLSLCQVNDGQSPLIQVVCGAKNVRAGMKVAFARVGTVIPATGQALKAGVIRGVESQGMLCSAQELLLAEDSDGILDLQTDLPPGSSLSAALGLDDIVIEVSITPNRTDCFSVRGIARDLAAAGIGVLKPLKKQSFQASKDCPIKVTLTDPACTYFTGCLIEGVTNGPSPDWLQKRLISVGQKPISALVDISNYLCFDLGQPLHAFDANKIASRLCVQPAEESETLTALNGQTYTLASGMTTVRDDTGVLALGGIIGGESSACTPKSTRVFLEAAHFAPLRIAQTGQSLNLHTDARARFERGVDPEQIIRSLNAATQMILNICGGEASQPIEVGCLPENVHTITLTQKKLTSLTGDPNLTINQAGKSLERLGLTLQSETVNKLTINTPSWRHDLQIEVDLIEEVLRLNGYQNIPVTSLPINLPYDRTKPIDKIRQAICQRGLDEILSWSFTDKTAADLFGTGIELSAPLNQDMAVLRPSLLTGLLKAVSFNQTKSQPNSTFFEIAHQFQMHNDKIKEENVAAGVRAQSSGDRHWLTPPRLVDVFDAKADVQAVLDSLGIQGYQVDTSGPDYYHPGRKGVIKQGPKTLAYFGELHPTILKAFDLQGPVMGFEIFLDRLPVLTIRSPKPLTLSPYQAVTRDFAFVVPQGLSCDTLIKTIQKAHKTLIQGIQLFDLYQGDKVEAGKKSLGIEVKLQSAERTLTEEDLNAFTQNVTQLVEKHCGGVLRIAAC